MSGEGPPRQSPFSPFPFGSPLGMSSIRASDQKNSGNSGSDSAAASGNSSGSGTSTSPNQSSAFGTSIYLKGRVRAQEAYGGPVMFGGHTSNRKSRMISASPYAASALASRKPHQRPLFDELGSSSRGSEFESRRGSSAANTPSPAPSPSPSNSSTSENGVMSSTARLIFDTLEKMSTPVRDAQKLIPSVSCSPPRAEKRRLIAEQFDWCQNSLKRRRPQLGPRASPAPGSNQLNGPPLRTIFSPVPASPKPRSKAVKSARILSSPAATSTESPKKTSDIIARDNINASSSLLGVQAFNLGQSSGSNPVRGEEKKLFTKQQPSVTQGTSSSASWNNTLLNSWGNSSHVSSGVPSSNPGGGGGGKMRAKVSEPMHHSKPTTSQDMLGITTGVPSSNPDPVQNFLAAHNTALPLKDMPVFNFGKGTDSKEISRTSTAETLPLNPSPKRPLDQDLTKPPPDLVPVVSTITASASYQFSMPSPAAAASSSMSRGCKVSGPGEANAMPNGILFSFCQPKGVVTASTSLPNLEALPSRPATNFTSKSDISLHKNHTTTTTLPDLTMRSAAKSSPGNNGIGSGGVIPAKSLKSGSVLDILGRDHSLPDVTASAGIKVANTFNSDSVMKKVRSGPFK